MIDAVGYIRMSSDKQEASPVQQRQEIKKLAERDGYRIVRWYVDEGISGDATEKRRRGCRLPWGRRVRVGHMGVQCVRSRLSRGEYATSIPLCGWA